MQAMFELFQNSNAVVDLASSLKQSIPDLSNYQAIVLSIYTRHK